MKLEGNLHRVRQARELFFCGSDIPPELRASVRPEIWRSWHRSKLSGADPTVPTLRYRGDIDPASKLRLAASSVLDRLSTELEGLPIAIFLGDAEGTTIHRWVKHPGMLRRLEAIQSEVGMSSAEEIVGTNGSGTAIEDRCTVQVSGPEHYAEALQMFTCASSPIFRPATRQVAGAVTLTCSDADANKLLAPIVAHAAAEIGERLFNDRTLEERVLLHDFLLRSRRSSGAVMAISENLLITNPGAARLIEGTEQGVLWEFAARLIREGRDDRLQLQRVEVEVRSNVVTDGTRAIGVVLELEPLEKATRLGSSWAVHQGRYLRSLVGQSAAWLQVDNAARIAAASTGPVLVRGESGVGKNAVVRALFERESAPLATIDVAAIAVDGLRDWADTLRAVLADGQRVVVIRHLELLDAAAAAVVCGLVDDRRDRSNRVVGIMTTTAGEKPSTPQSVIDRFAVSVIDVPPLRDRIEDIPALVTAATTGSGGRGNGPHWSPAALQALSRLSWPGNVRELQNAVSQVVSRRPIGVVTVEDLPVDVRSRSHRTALTQMERAEVETIVSALVDAEGNKAVAAAALGISRSTLYRKLRGYGLDLDRLAY